METKNDGARNQSEYDALLQTAGVLDLSRRSRLCVTGNDRVRFLHGQVTNHVKRLAAGQGCYAAIVTAKGKMESDVNIFNLADEFLLDFEPGLAAAIARRLEKFIVADDVQIVDVAAHYGLLSVQGPKAGEAVRGLGLFSEIPAARFDSVKISDAVFGEIYLANHARLASGRELASGTAVMAGFDLFVPADAIRPFTAELAAAAERCGGCQCGPEAFETARIERGIPRFGADMTTDNLPQECGIEDTAISYNKGCYIGQEVINRIHSIGRVQRRLCGLRLGAEPRKLPRAGDLLVAGGKEVGRVTSAAWSPALRGIIALGCVRREANAVGTALTVKSGGSDVPAMLVELPFAA
ncbi:MAG: hypothetical protein KGR98_07405 [Verrucomicrobia bacterium]|nr:hypothetical protein [Verrucomicrobiota bacterium]MDE3098564.1 folate-binding protein YgfZ [Verrucomicrobiota bacterium]